jgi:hypothetical protein
VKRRPDQFPLAGTGHMAGQVKNQVRSESREDFADGPGVSQISSPPEDTVFAARTIGSRNPMNFRSSLK